MWKSKAKKEKPRKPSPRRTDGGKCNTVEIVEKKKNTVGFTKKEQPSNKSLAMTTIVKG